MAAVTSVASTGTAAEASPDGRSATCMGNQRHGCADQNATLLHLQAILLHPRAPAQDGSYHPAVRRCELSKLCAIQPRVFSLTLQPKRSSLVRAGSAGDRMA